MSHDYKLDYEALDLDDHDPWAVAQLRYRRLVQEWHPDRYTNRPREKVHAQNQFIRITRAFDNLRAFYRQNGRMPYETLTQAAHCRAEAGLDDGSSEFRHADVADADALSAPAGTATVSTARPNGGIGYHIDRRFLSRHAYLKWLTPVLLVMLATVVLVLSFEQREKKQAELVGKEVVLEAPPSAFKSDNSRIRAQETKESMIRDH
ncbi:MAG: hypothetical protein CSA54_01125 [Gammaproteobacteria bacterium]|nr:MAG: hypothetical protein CSA54_01125 [Gammaproteobacteria bacterium]